MLQYSCLKSETKDKNTQMINIRLKEIRQARGLTQKELAQKIGVSTGAIGLYETNRRMPDLSTLKKLADALNVSADYLIGRETGDVAFFMQDNGNSLRFKLSKEDQELLLALCKKCSKD